MRRIVVVEDNTDLALGLRNSLEIEGYRVDVGGDAVSLSPKEFDLLLALVDRQGAAATRVELMREVWAHEAARASPHHSLTSS